MLVKRSFDIILAIIAGVFAIPISIISMLVVKIASPESPVLFKQERIGYNCKPFTMLKIRSMTNERDEYGELKTDEERLKTWGKIIRKLSIDELPQILHILLGQMSWIGPRPLLPKEMLVMTKEEQRERQSMLPGITGWEAVNEEKSDSRREMAEFDLEYVRNWSLWLDFKIFWMTIRKLFKADRSDDYHRAPKMTDDQILTEERND